MNTTEEETSFFNTIVLSSSVVLSRKNISTCVDSIMGDAPPSSLKCLKCSSSDISYEHKQTRSMDEGMTTFFLCRSCGKRWKE
jgi:DNA-directed RNA polymerase subunit M/transcription elongation factor TFIIS